MLALKEPIHLRFILLFCSLAWKKGLIIEAEDTEKARFIIGDGSFYRKEDYSPFVASS